MDITKVLPVERISYMISLTTPRDACRLAVVSPVFKSAADSDLVWEKFMRSDYKLIIPNSLSPSSLITPRSKKDLYFSSLSPPHLHQQWYHELRTRERDREKMLRGWGERLFAKLYRNSFAPKESGKNVTWLAQESLT